MLEKLKKFELKKSEQKELIAGTLIPNPVACGVSIAVSYVSPLGWLGRWVHC
jgi:hypothetical protein